MKRAGTIIGRSYSTIAVTAVLLLAAACGGPAGQADSADSAPQDVRQEAGTLEPTPWSELRAKPAPVRPELAPNVTLGPDLPAKPASTPGAPAMAPLSTWTVSIAATNLLPWVTQTSTVTATANADVGPTPYYIRIAIWSGVVASCGYGTSCSLPVTEQTEAWDSYYAFISDSAGNVVATSPWIQLHFHVAQYYSLSVSPTTVAVGGSTTITSTSGYDVGPSPFYTELWDDTAGTLVRICGYGTTCSASVSQSAATTHSFRAYLSPLSYSYPPAGTLEIGPAGYVTWGTKGYTLSLVATDTYHYTATANVDVGPTPYYIEIFNLDGGPEFLGACGYGSQCTVNVYRGGSHIVAFITPYSTTISLPGIQASSNVIVAPPVIH